MAMNRRSPRSAGAALALLSVGSLLVLTAACTPVHPDPAGAAEAISRSGVTVIKGTALDDGRGTVLDVIRGKTPSLRVRQDVGKCPRITLRNDVSFLSQVNPAVYVDGTRATDTCILESIRSSDVEFLEIYPRGVTTRPGYGMHAHGLILLFMRS